MSKSHEHEHEHEKTDYRTAFDYFFRLRQERQLHVIRTGIFMDAWMVGNVLGKGFGTHGAEEFDKAFDKLYVDSTLAVSWVDAPHFHESKGHVRVTDRVGHVVFAFDFENMFHSNMDLGLEAQEECVFLRPEWISAYAPGDWEDELRTLAQKARILRRATQTLQVLGVLVEELCDKWGYSAPDMQSLYATEDEQQKQNTQNVA